MSGHYRTPRDKWPPRARGHIDMVAATASEAAAGISGAQGCFHVIGERYAALALYEAMSEVSESRMCAAWELSNGATIWSWLQTGEMYVHGGHVDDIAEMKSAIIALANVCGLWWADYDFAVPLADWIAEHGPAPGIGPGDDG